MKENLSSTSGKQGKRTRIGKKVGNVTVIMQVLSLLLAVGICVVTFRALAIDMLRQRCTNGTNMLEYTLSLAGDAEDPTQLLDDLKGRMGCEFTIFEGNVRAYTTVTQNGQRVVGTTLSPELSETVLQKGQSYVGNATILGEQYLCSYVPTRDSSGAVNGLLFAGISSKEVNRQIVIIVILSALASLLTVVAGILFLSVYLKKNVSAPLAKITQVASRLEDGDLGLTTGKSHEITIHSNDEIGELALIFEGTTQRLGYYIGEISSVLNAIAAGDLTVPPRQDYVGDFESIKTSLDSIQSKLNSTLSQIRESAEQVSSGAEQVSNSAQALAQGATEQASSVEELSATITDISENAKRTALATEQAGQFVEQAGGRLGESSEYVKQLNTAMNKISASSQEIGKIIATIENIAFQTNILALNAAVEAARAGSAGKGFSVVANEVRNLATKSDEAAKATKALIESSIAAVAEGGQAVNAVTHSLEQTSISAGGVTSQMSIVVDAVEQQTEALSQITDGIDQISSVVQTNSATSEESAAASEELSSQANLLKNLVEAFRLK